MKTVVMTGGTSGFGALAAEVMRKADDVEVLMGGRRTRADTGALPLDLADLASVRDFAEVIRHELAGRPVDSLVLNAGVILPDADHRTGAGLETAFAVNHLSHYLLVRLLLPVLADRARIVLTTSGTHDPATRAGLAPPRHANAELLAHPEHDSGVDSRPRVAGQHAYTASKLCTLLTARSLAHEPTVGERTISVVAFCPGQVFGTGLVKELALPVRIGWSVLGSPLGWLPRRFSDTFNSPAAAADALASLSLGHTLAPDGHVYAALRRGRLTWPQPSTLARDQGSADALWRDSARLVGTCEATASYCDRGHRGAG